MPPEFFVVPWGSATPPTGPTPQASAAQMALGGHCSYGYLGAGRSEKDVTPNTVLIYEADGANSCGFITCGFGDDVECLPLPQAIQYIIDTVKSSHPTTLQPTTSPTISLP